MKHLLNNLSEEEKNSIREQHEGGRKIVIENFRKLIETKSGDVKLYTESNENNSIKEQLTSSAGPAVPDNVIRITIKGNERTAKLKSGPTMKITDHNYGNIELTNATPNPGKYIKFVFNNKTYTCTGTQNCTK